MTHTEPTSPYPDRPTQQRTAILAINTSGRAIRAGEEVIVDLYSNPPSVRPKNDDPPLACVED